MRIGDLRRGSAAARQLIERHGLHARARGRLADNQERPELGAGTSHAIEAIGEAGVRHRYPSTRVRQEELEQIGRRQRVNEERHKPGPHGPEQSSRVGRRVVQKQQHPVTAGETQRKQSVAESGCIGTELAIRARTGGTGYGYALASTGSKIVKQNRTRIVTLGNGKADLARSWRVIRHAVGNRMGKRLHDNLITQ